ncbi:MAG TPA: alpha/beta fold hydrolase [Pseudolysinimonas sp.]|nr:alpha/beta fold hydrolase [Pseudolysinimonas sp.]
MTETQMTETQAWPHYTPPSRVLVHDLDVAYRRAGSGEPLLYFHGAALTRRWLPFHDALATRFDVIAPEHPGFGDTARPAWLADFRDVVLHYRDLLDTLKLGKVHLVGHGFGGWLAAEFAAVYPERLESLTLIAPSGLRPQDEDGDVVDIFRLEPEQAAEAMLGPDAARWSGIFDEGDPIEQAVRAYAELTTEALLSWNPRYDLKLEQHLPRISVPTRVLVPQHERMLAASIGRRYAELIPGALLTRVEGDDVDTEHLLILQEPQKIADLIHPFNQTGK